MQFVARHATIRAHNHQGPFAAMSDHDSTTAPQSSTPAQALTPADERHRNVTLVAYILMGLGVVVPLTSLFAVIICHIKRRETEGTIYESHMIWLIRTFWWTALGMIIAAVTMFILIGALVGLVVGVWFIYRVVKGFLAFNDRRPMADPRAWV